MKASVHRKKQSIAISKGINDGRVKFKHSFAVKPIAYRNMWENVEEMLESIGDAFGIVPMRHSENQLVSVKYASGDENILGPFLDNFLTYRSEYGLTTYGDVRSAVNYLYSIRWYPPARFYSEAANTERVLFEIDDSVIGKTCIYFAVVVVIGGTATLKIGDEKHVITPLGSRAGGLVIPMQILRTSRITMQLNRLIEPNTSVIILTEMSTDINTPRAAINNVLYGMTTKFTPQQMNVGGFTKFKKEAVVVKSDYGLVDDTF